MRTEKALLCTPFSAAIVPMTIMIVCAEQIGSDFPRINSKLAERWFSTVFYIQVITDISSVYLFPAISTLLAWSAFSNYHAREPLYSNSAVIACWLQSTSAQNSVPSCLKG